MSITITTATAPDEAGWRHLWVAYLTYYRVELKAEITDRTWTRIVRPEAPLVARIARRGGEMLGFAIHHHHPSTWVAGDDCYLEDLYVAEAARGKGVGRALMDDLIAIARREGWCRLYWHTDQNNHRARALYDSYVLSDGHIRYRLTL